MGDETAKEPGRGSADDPKAGDSPGKVEAGHEAPRADGTPNNGSDRQGGGRESPDEGSGSEGPEPVDPPPKPTTEGSPTGDDTRAGRRRRLLVALAIYVVTCAVFAVVAGSPRMSEHTPYNHYALLADAWVHGRHDLPHGPPAYTGNNDFAEHQGKTYISFPPFPAVLMLPLVKLAGSAEDFRDGQFVVWLAGIGPAVLFLVLEKLRRTGRSARTATQNIVFALLFAFGSVYFFTAVQGTVWFAAHVVGVGLCALYLLLAIDAERPLLAGLVMACAWSTRPPMLLLVSIFALEAVRVSCRGGLPEAGTLGERVSATLRRIDAGALTKRLLWFALPVLVSFALASWYNRARFGESSPFAFGHEHLTVQWHARMAKWGLFSTHYLAKNLGVALTSLPWLPPKGGEAAFGAPFKINEHGLALWFTTPLFFWVLRPRRGGWLYGVLALGALLPAAQLLLYQNTGWQQFGYRFSNDYAAVLFVLLAMGGRPMRFWFSAAAVWSIAWNLFGAVTFGRGGPAERYYFREGTQTVLYQPD